MPVGEFELIEWLRRRAGPPGRRFGLGIGDDAALLRPRAGRELVLTTDASVEGVHFRWSTSEPRFVGEKVLHANLSDLAAMGARPLGLLLTLGLPEAFERTRIEALLGPLVRAARVAGAPLVGGDCVRAPVTLLSITALGEVARGRALRRDAARVGDRILVTGTLGDAALGLAWLEGRRSEPSAFRSFVRRQQRPRARLEAGLALSRLRGVGAVIDVSDGLVPDLGHVLRAGGVGAEVAVERLPLRRGFAERCERLELAPLDLALRGGEEYELLFTLRPGKLPVRDVARRLGCRVAEIGRVTEGPGLSLLDRGRSVPDPGPRFAHFKGT